MNTNKANKFFNKIKHPRFRPTLESFICLCSSDCPSDAIDYFIDEFIFLGDQDIFNDPRFNKTLNFNLYRSIGHFADNIKCFLQHTEGITKPTKIYEYFLRYYINWLFSDGHLKFSGIDEASEFIVGCMTQLKMTGAMTKKLVHLVYANTEDPECGLPRQRKRS